MFKKPINIQIIVIVILSLFLLISIGYVYSQSKLIDSLVTLNNSNQKLISTLSDTDVGTDKTPSTPTVIPTSTDTPTSTNIKFLDKPVKITADIFNKSIGNDIYFFDKTEIYHVGNFKDGTRLIFAYIPTSGMGITYTNLFKFQETKDGKYLFLPYHLSEYQNYEQEVKNFPNHVANGIFGNKVSLSTTHYTELDNQEYVDTVIGKFKLSGSDILPSEASKLTREGDSNIYYSQQSYNKLDGVDVRQFYIKQLDSSVVSYDLYFPFYQNGVYNPPIVWNDTTANKSAFHNYIESHCGTDLAGDYIITPRSSLVKDMVDAGKIDGVDVYKITNPDSSFIKLLYSQFILTAPTPVMSISDYAAKNTHFFYKDKTSNYFVFINSEYSLMAECGKPVIYLYPTKTTNVSVKVGADITQSDPIYSTSGWQVTARPNGQIISDSRIYTYLFWEGIGHGSYPNLNGKGFVVDQANLIPTIKNHLSKLGLNQQETADFLEFWQSRLPKTKYVRLSWLGTADMNVLAPLTVSPKPDTVIRLFLEFEGLDAPINLTPQKLVSIPRRGFTLIEWGGLLIK